MDRITGPLEIIAPSEASPALRVIPYDAASIASAIEVVNPAGDSSDIRNPNALAEVMNFVAWTVDPVLATTSATQANTHLGAVYLPRGRRVQGIYVPVGSGGTSVTMSKVGIYDQLANLLVQSPDNLAGVQAAGFIAHPFTAPFTAPYSGLYYLGSGQTASGTLPSVLNFAQFSGLSNLYPNANSRPRGVHAAVPSGGNLPNPATAAGAFTNFPCLIAY